MSNSAAKDGTFIFQYSYNFTRPPLLRLDPRIPLPPLNIKDEKPVLFASNSSLQFSIVSSAEQQRKGGRRLLDPSFHNVEFALDVALAQSLGQFSICNGILRFIVETGAKKVGMLPTKPRKEART